jgi:hypothetical protein
LTVNVNEFATYSPPPVERSDKIIKLGDYGSG